MNYLDRMQAAAEEAAKLGEEVGFQKCADFFFLALAEDGWGAARLKALYDSVHVLQAEYAEAYRCSEESDWLQERMDEKLKRACGEHFVPFRVRNPYIKQFNYHKHSARRK